MNRQEFEDTARRYREELFRMYASQNLTPQPKPAAAVPAVEPHPIKPQPKQQAAEPQPAAVPVQNALPADLPPDAPQNTASPEPSVIPEPESDRPADADDPALPKRDYTGIIRVHVATAQGARPVAGAAVIITQIHNGQTSLISLQTTDQSGNIAAVTVPAPQPSADQRHPEAFYYDISAQARGYYREHSTDVPVFPNVTSVQNFDLIPLPAGADDTDAGGDITYYNRMQQY